MHGGKFTSYMWQSWIEICPVFQARHLVLTHYSAELPLKVPGGLIHG